MNSTNAPHTMDVRKASHNAARRHQRGSVVISSAIALSALVIVLLGIELGHLFYMKREYQKAADLAAMAGAQALRPGEACASRAEPAARANATLNLPSGVAQSNVAITCRHWDPVKYPVSPHLGDPAAGERLNAVQVLISHSPSLLLPAIPGNAVRNVEVIATAAQRHQLAALNIRSTLATVDTDRAALLNSLVGGLLGGSINIGAVGWEGLVNTDVKLLSYLDQLAVDLNVAAGNYEQVLNTKASVGTLLEAMLKVLQRNGSVAQVTLTALDSLTAAADLAAIPDVRLGDLIGLQTGTPSSGLDLNVQAFQLVEGLVQLATKDSAASATVKLGPLTAHVKVIESPQISAVGDPDLARTSPLDVEDRIYVRTAQVRTLVSLDLPVLSAVSGLVGAVDDLLNPVTNLLNTALSSPLSLLSDVLSCLFACTRDTSYTRLLPAPLRLDISLDAGGAQSYVTDFNCTGATRSLTATTITALANLRIGKLGDTAAAAKANAFATRTLPTVNPLGIVEIGAIRCTRVLLGLFPVACDESTRRPYHGGGLGILAQVPVGQQSTSQVFDNPPELSEAPAYETVSSQNIVASLAATLNGLNLLYVIPPTGPLKAGITNLVSSLTGLLNGITTLVSSVVTGLLSPLLDPLLNTLLKNGLGINLAEAEVGARLSCKGSAELVF